MHRFTTPGTPRLSIEFQAGTIEIRTHDVDQTTVDLTGSDDSAAQAQIAAAVIDQRGDEVIVRVPKRSTGVFGDQPELRLDITAPRGTRLDVTSGSADLDARGHYGESRVASGSGDASIERLTGAAHIRSGSGDVRVGAGDADVSIGTGSGNVRVGTVEADLSVGTGSGDITVGAVAGAISARTGSGDVLVDRAGTDVHAKTGSGDVSLGRVAHGRVKARAASGDLRVRVADGIPAWLDVRTVTGEVSSDLEASEPVGADEQYVRLDLKTVSGDIAIARV